MNVRNNSKALGMKAIGAGAVVTLGLWGCAAPPPAQNDAVPATAPTATATVTAADNTGTTEEITRAVAVLHPTRGNNIRGTVTFTRETGGIRVVADISGLTPGKHGFHVHENGDCSAPDATSAGGHFNPTKMPHAGMDADQRHVGDLGNVTADSSGKARYDQLDTMIAFEGDSSIIGRAVIVHAKADDLKSQPSGDAGARGACGVVGLAK